MVIRHLSVVDHVLIFFHFWNLLFIHLFEYVLCEIADSVDLPGETEVTQLDSAILVQEYVGRFEVTVKDLGVADVLYSMQQIPNDRLDVQDLKRQAALNQLFEIRLTILKHDIDLRKVHKVGRNDDVQELNNAWMLQLTEEHYLTQDALGVDLVFEEVAHPLDRDFLASGELNRLGDLAVATSADEFLELVLMSGLPAIKLIFLVLEENNAASPILLLVALAIVCVNVTSLHIVVRWFLFHALFKIIMNTDFQP